jgi:hypothetical protein
MGLIGSGTTNECKVVTIFPLGVECDTTNPSTSLALDGIASLIITGGTAPYNIHWSNGGASQTLYGLGGGEYTATVTDYYGDFTSVTTCLLIQPTTTTTLHTTTTTTSQYFSGITFCFRRCKENDCDSFTFEGSNIINGYNSWTSTTNNLLIYYDTTAGNWVLSGYTVPIGYTAGVTTSNNSPTANPPLNWSVQGTNYRSDASAVIGNCTTQTATFARSITNSSCSTSKDGSIIVTPNGGSGSYLYSKNGGLTYQSSPVFSNLDSGLYTVVIKDTITNLTKSEVVAVSNTTGTRTFNLNLLTVTPTVTYLPPSNVYDITQQFSQTKQVTPFTVIPNPVLQVGETLTFDFTFRTNTSFQSPGSAVFTNNLLLYKNGILLTGSTSTTTNTTVGSNICSANTLTSVTSITAYNAISLTYGDTLSGSVYSNTSLSATSSVLGCSSSANNLVSYGPQNLRITPQKCRLINSTSIRNSQFTNNLNYIQPPLNISFTNKWLTNTESGLSGFTYGGNVNSPTSPGTTPKISYNFTTGCLTQNTSCFPTANTVNGGPLTGVTPNQLTIQGGTRGGIINLLLQLGGILSGGACAKIFGTLKVSINSGSYTTLATLNGGLGTCSTTYSYVIPLNANSVEFLWEQTRI